MTMAKFVAALFAAVVVALAGAEVGEEEETATQQKVRSHIGVRVMFSKVVRFLLFRFLSSIRNIRMRACRDCCHAGSRNHVFSISLLVFPFITF